MTQLRSVVRVVGYRLVCLLVSRWGSALLVVAILALAWCSAVALGGAPDQRARSTSSCERALLVLAPDIACSDR